MSKRISNHESAQQHVESIRRATRKQYSAEEKIRIVLEGLRGEYFIVELCRREGIAQSLYYAWSKEFLEAGKKRPSNRAPWRNDDCSTPRRLPKLELTVSRESQTLR